MFPCTLFNSRLQRKQLTNDEFPLVPMWVLARSSCLLLWLRTKQVFLKKIILVAIFKDSPLINNWAVPFYPHPKCIFQGFSFYSQNCELEILNLSQNEWAIHKNRPTLLISLQIPASKLCLSLWAVTMCLYTPLVTVKLKRWELYRPEFVYFVALFHDDKYDDPAPLYSHSAPASVTDPGE